MSPNITYTQQVDEKTGEIKYVPNNPPTPPPSGTPTDMKTSYDESQLDEIKDLVSKAQLTEDDKLTQTLMHLMDNNRRLRYNRRLETGKLDGRRLTAYKTSDKLFKRKAIKDKHYQFTFLVDTSGSMLGQISDTANAPTRIAMSLEAVARTVKTLDALKVKSAIFGMNNTLRLFKSFGAPLDDAKLLNDTYLALVEDYEDGEGEEVQACNGTNEWIAYEQATKYITEHSTPKITNVVVVISDGAPGGMGSTVQVTLEGEPFLVPNKGDKDSLSTLARFWDKRPEFLAFGLGIGRKAEQVPTNRQIDDITKLPEVMSKLLTELML